MDQTQTSTQPEQIPAEEKQKNIVISPIQLLVNATLVAYQRGAFTMKEAGLISQAIDYFTVETKQAKLPEINDINNKSDKSENDKNEKVVFQSQ
jgi:hypothetical protein